MFHILKITFAVGLLSPQMIRKANQCVTDPVGTQLVETPVKNMQHTLWALLQVTTGEKTDTHSLSTQLILRAFF